jgi:myosin heavy subunit
MARTETKQNVGGATIQALLRATLRHDDHIESLQKENDGLLLQARALEEAQMRCSRLILAAEGKYDEVDAPITPTNGSGKQLEARIKALEAAWTKDLPRGQAMKENHRLATKLGIVEKRIQTQARDIADAKQLVQEKTTKLTERTTQLTHSLAAISKIHEENITELENTAKRSSEWRKQQDKVMREQKTQIEKLESELRRQKEDKQKFKMSIEGRVDALLRHHQENADTMMKKMNAMEKVVERQSAQISYLKMRGSPENAHSIHPSPVSRKLYD